MVAEFITDVKYPHLGGNYDFFDKSSNAKKTWDYLIDKYDIKTSIDLGGGYGYAAKYLISKGVQSVNVDGLPKNVENSVAPAILHDLTEGPLQHNKVDLVNSVELVEHVEEKYIDNLLESLALGKYILMTHARPGQEGYHHVNCQPQEYWIEKLTNYGFTFSEEETNKIRKAESAWHVKRSALFFIKNI